MRCALAVVVLAACGHESESPRLESEPCAEVLGAPVQVGHVDGQFTAMPGGVMWNEDGAKRYLADTAVRARAPEAEWLDQSPSVHQRDGAIYRVDGGREQVVWKAFGEISDLLVDGNDIYAASSMGLVWIDQDAGDRVTELSVNGFAYDLTLRGDRLYWHELERIKWMPRHGGPITTRKESMELNRMALGRSDLYFTSDFGHELWSMPIERGEPAMMRIDARRHIRWMRETSCGLLVREQVRSDSEIEELWLLPLARETGRPKLVSQPM